MADRFAVSRAAFRLHEEGLTHRVIAGRLGVRLGRVGYLVHLGRRAHMVACWRAGNEQRQRITAMGLDRNLGRPIDMGGPRDVWIEYDPWDRVA